MERREPPQTAEGWYALHDFRRIDWDAWRATPERERERAIAEGTEYLAAHERVEDADAGGSAVFAVVGHKADLLMLHLRPTLAQLDRAERRFETTALAGVTDRASSYLSVTEVSGYMHEDLDEGLETIEDTGMRNYMRQRLYPAIPDAAHVCFYPMDKRRDAEHNWYDLPFEERAEYMSAHGELGREYAGKVTQIITGSVGLDDHEWGVTLFADDMVDIKHLLYEMRFDPSSSRFAEFGQFYVGRRISPDDLDALLTGDAVAAAEGSSEDRRQPATPRATVATGDDGDQATESGDDAAHPPRGEPTHEEIDAADFASRITRFGIDLDEYPTAGYGLLFHSSTDAEELVAEVDGLRENFEHYDTHCSTTVRADAGDTAVISLWATERAARTASGFLGDLSGTGPGVGAILDPDAAVDGDTDAAAASDESVPASDPDLRAELADLDVYAGQPHGEDVHAVVLYSETVPTTLAERVDALRENFEHYDTHVRTAVYGTNPDRGEGAAETDHGQAATLQFRSAVVSIWETADAASTASGFLADLPGVVARAGDESGFGTMGMFYTVKPDYREEFLETFDDVAESLAEIDGHLETRLLINEADENDMFIASQWRDREAAMAFFRSETFRETVEWGREVLADRPRHVFLT